MKCPKCNGTGNIPRPNGTELFGLTEMMTWLESFFNERHDAVKRSGAAQGYAEIIVSFDESFIDKHLMRIIHKIQEGNSIQKEGYLSVFVFLPGCLGDKFEKYFELIFPLIIEGFSDNDEKVRNVSNKNIFFYSFF